MSLTPIFIPTADGSLTLRLGGPSQAQVDPVADSSETMHSLRGAFSETVYIYGTAIQTCLEKGFPPKIFSLGLGMGYVELLATALILKSGVPADVAGESFELVPELRDWFRSWVTGVGEVPADFVKAYEEVLQRTSAEVGVPSSAIKSQLADWLRTGQWQLREALTTETKFDQKFSCICFDAFSSKTSPELWTEDFLTRFFADVCAPGCVLSTYACTGALKRSLRAAGFDLQIREGFASKRDSTFAVRTPALHSDEKL